jgi:hypothetical protein
VSDQQPESEPIEDKDGESSRFQKLARALFGVDKRDVPKHEPKKRETQRSNAP